MNFKQKARKRFGQNFLHDPGIIAQILAAINPQASENIVEIGPGRGALTAGLLTRAGSLTAIELDRDLIEPLHLKFSSLGNFNLIQQDALKYNFCGLNFLEKKLRIVGNLPYNIATPLLFYLLNQHDKCKCIQDLHLMLQREVVARIVAAPGSKVYGRLSVMVQTYCEATRLFVIGPGAFTPAPQVDSALLRLRPWLEPPYPCHNPAWHARLVTAAFGQRRKTLRNSLAGLITENQMHAIEINPNQRAEDLDIAGYAKLANVKGLI